MNKDYIKESADKLAKFIAKNWHYCPIDENWNIKDCECWGSYKCKDCLLENAINIEG